MSHGKNRERDREREREAALDDMFGIDQDADEVRHGEERALAFLTACVDGDVPRATVSERITAAQALLEYAAKQQDLIAQLSGMVGQLSDENLAAMLEETA